MRKQRFAWQISVFRMFAELRELLAAEQFGSIIPQHQSCKAVHACMIRLMTLRPHKHEEAAICSANQRIPNVCRIAQAACCGAIREH